MVLLKCPICQKEFVRKRKQTHLCKKNSIATFCSKNCSAKYGVMIQNQKVTKEIQENIKNNVIMEFIETNK